MQPLNAAFTTQELGAWLKFAREQRKLAESDVAAHLRLQVASVHALERGDFEAVAAPVYVRGFIRSYAKLVDARDDALEALIHALIPDTAPELKPSHGPRVHGRPISERYAWAFSYAVGTALVLPLVWVLMRLDTSPPQSQQETSQSSAVRIVDNEPPASGIHDDRVFDTGHESPDARSVSSASVREREPAPYVANNSLPVLASMSPFPSTRNTLGSTSASPDSFELVIEAASWVEMIDGNGQRLEYDVIEKGRHSYSGVSPIQLRAGNAGSVKLVIAGQELSLADFAKANVARVKLSRVNDRWVAESTPGR